MNEKLVTKRIDYLNNDFYKFNKLSLLQTIKKHNYKLFTKEELDNKFNECCTYIIKYMKSLNVKKIKK